MILVVVGVLVGAGVMISRQPAPSDSIKAESAFTETESVIRSYSLPPAERQPALERLRELKQGGLSDKQYKAVLQTVDKAPLKRVVGHDVLIRKYINLSQVSEEEKQRGHAARQRYLRGLHELTIHPKSMDHVLEPVRRKNTDETIGLDPSPPAEQISKLIDRLEQHADSAEVPEEPYELDYQGELLQVVNDAAAASA